MISQKEIADLLFLPHTLDEHSLYCFHSGAFIGARFQWPGLRPNLLACNCSNDLVGCGGK